MAFVSVAVAAAETNFEVLPAVANRRYRLLHVSLSVDDEATGTASLHFGASPGTPVIAGAPASANVRVQSSFNKNEVEGGVGEGLFVTTGAGAVTSVTVVYEELHVVA